MSKNNDDSFKKHVQKVCTLRTHDDAFSKDDVIVNIERFPELNLSVGSLAKILAIKKTTQVHDFHRDPSNQHEDGSGADGSAKTSRRRQRAAPVTVTLDETGSTIAGGREVDLQKCYVLVVKGASQEQKAKLSHLQVSIHKSIADIFGFRNQMQVVLSTADEESHSASHVEITFREGYLSRADMWRLTLSELSQKSVYKGQKILFLGTVRGIVKNVYVNEQSTRTAYFSSSSKPIFRSESARYVLFIQMSKEMWDFDSEGSGEIMFNKVINGFLPELFKRWMKINARHLVTIILFSRLEYEVPAQLDQMGSEINNPNEDLPSNNTATETRDFYRVVVSEMASGDWINILYQLKKEFKTFLRDVSLVSFEDIRLQQLDQDNSDHEERPPVVIAGKPTRSFNGNVLEAINLAATQFSEDYIDRDLIRTGISIIVISPGSGLFEVDYNMLKLTTDTLVGTGIGIDLVCLSPMPLHSVPLFKYRSPVLVKPIRSENAPLEKKYSVPHFRSKGLEHSKRLDLDRLLKSEERQRHGLPPLVDIEPGEWGYAIPHWLDISFWSGPIDESFDSSRGKQTLKVANKRRQTHFNNFDLRCRMYELQMMGITDIFSGIDYLGLLSDEVGEYPGLPTGFWRRPFQDRKQRQYLTEENEPYGDMTPLRLALSDEEEITSGEEDRLKPLRTTQLSLKGWMEDYDRRTFQKLTDKERPRQLLHVTSRKRLEANSTKKDSTHLSQDDEDQSSSKVKSALELTRTYDSQSNRAGRSNNGSRRASVVPQAVGVGEKTIEHKGHRNSSITPLRATRPGNHQQRVVSDFEQRHKYANMSEPQVTHSISPHLRSDNLGYGRGHNDGAYNPAYARSMYSSSPSSQTGVKSGKSEVSAASKDDASTSTIDTSSARDVTDDSGRRTQPITIKASNVFMNPDESEKALIASGSGDTVKETRIVHTHEPLPGGQPSSAGNAGLFIYSGSKELRRRVGPKPLDLEFTKAKQEHPDVISPTSALAPWLVLVNPCNPKKNHVLVNSQFRRWQHVFPRPLRTSSIKWKSLCSPASVPLTNEYFPSPDQLAEEYQERPYKIAQNDEDDNSDIPKSRKALIRELVAHRLSHGFQVIVGQLVATYSGAQPIDTMTLFKSDFMSQDGDRVFMCVGHTIHQLVCAPEGGIEVRRFSRKPTVALESRAGVDSPLEYTPFIRTALELDYRPRKVTLKPPGDDYNWNYIDNFLAGYYEDFSDSLRFWRARFVLIPVELKTPHHNRRLLPSVIEDSEEEMRLEGIRKLTQVWQRNRYIPPEERAHQSRARKRKIDTNPLAIEYQTRDPSVIIAAGPDNPMLAEGEQRGYVTQIFADSELYHRSSIDLHKLAQDLQGEKGIPMGDRRWHLRLHYNCFTGFDLTTWLLQNFSDVDDRDEAVELGNDLMKRGLFQHVSRKHQFRDGHFLYQITSEYRPDARIGWFPRRADRSVPSTPYSDLDKGGAGRKHSRPSTDSDNERTPTKEEAPRRKVKLSHVMRYDVDPRKKSYRSEIINLHYDRLHNPDNCYHIRIDWMNVTAKFIEDAIQSWSSTVERYGLKLVELPIAEASSISEGHPFRAPYIVKLAVQPPAQQPAHFFDTTSFTPLPLQDKFFYNKALLRKLNFVLDIESAASFPPNVDVKYSWGKPDYKYTQYIHKSGVLLVQITDEGHFLLTANRLANTRTSKDPNRFNLTEHSDRWSAGPAHGTHSGRNSDRTSPYNSPLVRAIPENYPVPPRHWRMDRSRLTPEQLKDDMEAFCSDEAALRSFYDEVFKPKASPSPNVTPILDSQIPALGLPPSITVRDTSPSPRLGAPMISSDSAAYRKRYSMADIHELRHP
ncbi:hypothetical protein M501DRAFT_975696 [Patellaria atrata CBS 101060]|uniref:Vacuolar membrane-associated protein IML1 n=1 Tax=Patellaria atrata CBS 101060 TaxID=1346257 RepID=A0A9P4SBY5_9PEZI|nr:hypothetical protein M501DRAFT_975696 [Patellaria atrata CBS 101060]